jgi:hypothetical protein
MPTIVVGGKNRADKSSKDNKSKDKKDKKVQFYQDGGAKEYNIIGDIESNLDNQKIFNKNNIPRIPTEIKRDLGYQRDSFNTELQELNNKSKKTEDDNTRIKVLEKNIKLLTQYLDNPAPAPLPTAPVSVPAPPPAPLPTAPAAVPAAPGASDVPQTVEKLIREAKESIDTIIPGTGKVAREEALNNAVKNFTEAVELVKKLGDAADSAQADAEEAQAALTALQTINTSSMGGDRKLRKSKSKSKK